MQSTQEVIIKAFDHVFHKRNDHSAQFFIYQIYHLLNKEPVKVLETLFFQYYWRQEAVCHSTLKSFLIKTAPTIYPAMIKFSINLERSYVLACLEKNFFTQQIRFISQVRNMIREPLERLCADNHPSTAKVRHVLKNMKHTDNMVQQLRENLRIPFEFVHVFEDIEHHLIEADQIADLQCFKCAYFDYEQLKHHAMDLEKNHLTPFFISYLEQLLTPAKKEQIKQVLKYLIEHYQIKQQGKQAFALYLTLDDHTPWQKNPFILRLVYNSYWHHKVVEIAKRSLSTSPGTGN